MVRSLSEIPSRHPHRFFIFSMLQSIYDPHRKSMKITISAVTSTTTPTPNCPTKAPLLRMPMAAVRSAVKRRRSSWARSQRSRCSRARLRRCWAEGTSEAKGSSSWRNFCRFHGEKPWKNHGKPWEVTENGETLEALCVFESLKDAVDGNLKQMLEILLAQKTVVSPTNMG